MSICFVAFVSANVAQADFTIRFSDANFGVTPVFNDVVDFEFDIVMSGDVTAGMTYTQADVVGVDYTIFGLLPDPTPSGVPNFFLDRSLTGQQFRGQGGTMFFEISAGADLSDGLQFDELTGLGGPLNNTFSFDAREVNTGAYQPPIVSLDANGMGIVQNSDNFGGINPKTGMMVDVDYGEEYITNVTFDPATFSLVAVPVPEPGSAAVIALAFAGIVARRRR